MAKVFYFTMLFGDFWMSRENHLSYKDIEISTSSKRIVVRYEGKKITIPYNKGEYGLLKIDRNSDEITFLEYFTLEEKYKDYWYCYDVVEEGDCPPILEIPYKPWKLDTYPHTDGKVETFPNKYVVSKYTYCSIGNRIVYCAK